MEPIIPVIVLNWNGLGDTLACVDSLLAQVHCKPQIFLADNGSAHQEAETLQQTFSDNPQVTVLPFEDNLGFTRAHLRVFEEQISGKGYTWLALLNNDAVAEPDWLSKLYQSAEQHKAASVASCMLQFDSRNTLDNTGHEVLNTAEVVPRGFGGNPAAFQQAGSVLGACAGACLYRVDVLERIGFFDPHFQTGYEDAELGLRLFLAGETTHYEPKARVYHKMGQSIRKVRSVSYLKTIQANVFYTWFKLMPTSILLLNLPFMLFKYSMVFLMDIVFLRFRFLRVMRGGIAEAWNSRALIREKRREFYQKSGCKRSFWSIQQNLRFFLLFDLKRFVQFVVLKRHSNLEA